MTKTAVIWVDVAEGIVKYYVIPEDWRRFHGVIINVTEDDGELTSAMYDSGGYPVYKACGIEEFKKAIIEGAYLVECGFCS